MSKQHKKRAPFRQAPLGQAGGSGHERAMDLLNEKALPWLMVVVVLVVVTMAQWIAWWQKKPIPPHLSTFVTVILGLVAVVKIRTTVRGAQSIVLGVRGERLVGQLLEELRPKGYRIFHDIQGKGFNVDHVIIGPGGVFVIETKTVSKSIRGNPKIIYDGEQVVVDGLSPDRDPIAQAKACRDHIRDILMRASTVKPKMRAVVLYPGWWVETRRKDVEVWVLNEIAFVKYLDYEEHVLSEDQVAILSEALATHVRAAV